jgi:DNA ligase-1
VGKRETNERGKKEMSLVTKPMLAVTCEDINTLKFPVLASPKLDGIRCLIINGQVLSRKFKLIPNEYIRSLLSKLPNGLDGELMLRRTVDSGQQATFQQVTSSVMSEDGKPDFEYNVFDYVRGGLEEPYQDRMIKLSNIALPSFVRKVLPKKLSTLDQLHNYEEKCLAEGYEGVMVRSPNSPYKCGRSTVKEGFLLKIKRFKDSEAEVVGFEERMHNNNEAKIDELGHTKRSSHKENLVPAGMLGAFVVRDLTTGLEFSIGTGFDDEMRKEIWKNPYNYIRKIVKYKYQAIGQKDLPRFPVFVGFRNERDM